MKITKLKLIKSGKIKKQRLANSMVNSTYTAVAF
jgi:hypothetical protein